MSKFIEINGVRFEVVKPRKFNAQPTHGHADLYSYYARPSDTKRAIYNEWLDWCYSTEIEKGLAEIDSFHVSGANIMQFSLAFNILYMGVWYVACITKAHNRLIVIE